MNSDIRRITALFFIASPLHYLAARRIAVHYEAGSRCIVVPYRPSARQLIREEDWDAVAYAPWPRFDPLPGVFGRHRRLLANLRNVAAIVGDCDILHIHSPVFDTEAINYFLRGLPKLCGASTMRARILPDGLLNVARYPLSASKRLLQTLRRLRRLASPQLDYWCFQGDRIGSDAPFVDRIYTIAGFPHEYPSNKVFNLPPLATSSSSSAGNTALIIGQPLVGIGALKKSDHDAICMQIADWLKTQGIDHVVYKAHPRDQTQEFRISGAKLLEITDPLEIHMTNTPYRAVIGVYSTGLYLARQIYGAQTMVVSFGCEKVHFKKSEHRAKFTQLMDKLGIIRL